MKKFIILVLLISRFSAAYSQDLIGELKKMTLEKDSLQKEFKLAKENWTKKLQVAYDSITHLLTVNENTTLNLKSKIEKLENDAAGLYKQIKKLDKSNIKNLETQLQQKTDSLIILKGALKEKELQIATIRDENAKKEQDKYNEGLLNVYNQISQIYQRNTFDYLIKYSTQQSIERDLPLVGNNVEIKKKLQDLQIYFAAQKVLEERYNEQKVKNAQSQVSSITQSDLVKTLKDNIVKYKLCNDALKTTIGKIIEIDKKFVANDEYTQKTKLQDILFELSWYFRNYSFNLADYPYLSEIILEIMKRKQKDANANINNLVSQL